jgi:hypothetical protein
MQVYDLSAVDGALLCGGMLLYFRSVKRSEAIFAGFAAAALLAAHWLAPYAVYVAASFICPLSFIAYLLYSRHGWRRLRAALARWSRRGEPAAPCFQAAPIPQRRD